MEFFGVLLLFIVLPTPLESGYVMYDKDAQANAMSSIFNFMRGSPELLSDLSSPPSSVHNFTLGPHEMAFAAVSEENARGQMIERAVDYQFLTKYVEAGENDVFIDIGANIGTYSVLLSKLFPRSRIYAFEPMPTTFVFLMYNLMLNGATNVIPYNMAVAKTNGRQIMQYVHEWPGMSMAKRLDHKNFISRKMTPVLTSTVTWSALTSALRVEKIRLLKIDCEGCEYEIVQTIGLKQVGLVCGELHHIWGRLMGFNDSQRKVVDVAVACHNWRRKRITKSCVANMIGGYRFLGSVNSLRLVLFYRKKFQVKMVFIVVP